jgi:hypothetical protein
MSEKPTDFLDIRFANANPESSDPQELGRYDYDRSVITQILAALPSRSEMGKYLEEPAIMLVRVDWRAKFRELPTTKGEELLTDLGAATKRAAAGSVAYANLLSGMVQGDKTDLYGAPNLRGVFDRLEDLGLSDRTDYHTLFDPHGVTGGAISKKGYEGFTSEKDSRLLGAGAAQLRDKKAFCVLFTDETGEPYMKMFAITDPQTGKPLDNMFMTVCSVLLPNTEGTTEMNNARLATADIIVIPEEFIDATSKE